MVYRVFYCCDSTREDVGSDDGISMDRDTLISKASQVLRKSGDFVGAVDDQGTTLQFRLEEDGRVWMEVPREDEGGSYGKHIPLDEVERVLLALPDRIDHQAFTDMEFVSWD